MQPKQVGCSERLFGCLCWRNSKTRFVVLLSFLEHPLFKDLLRRSEEEFGFDHPMGGLTIHCQEDIFTNLISRLHVS
ncbi:putative small auxin-up RNA [Helianthus annuus]|nr:putative small auxin-up RNA [Helianthus annuus]